MAISLITGTPGAGKTCYAVSQVVVGQAGKKITVEDPVGTPYEVTRRIVVAGVRGLAVEHERLPHPLTGEKVSQVDIDRWNAVDDEGNPRVDRLPFAEPIEVEASLFNWWLWCKPGDLIVVDEVQFLVARGTLNKKAPPYINRLAMHRHYGVDFLFITQHPDFLDPFMRKLVSLHRHVRSLLGFPLCMVYTWDHASNPERYSLATKGKYLRRKAHYALYKSAQAHVKPPTSGRGIFVVLPLLLAAVAALAFSYKARHAETSAVAALALPAVSLARPVADARPPGWLDVPKLTGCYAYRDQCGCIGEDGRPVKVALAMCRTSSEGFGGLVQWEKSRSKAPEAASAPSPTLTASAPRLAAL